MDYHDSPAALDLVLAGGGHAHVAVLKRLGMKPLPGIRATLVCPAMLTPYSGMLPGLIAGHYRHDEAHIDLRRLARFAGADIVEAAVTGVDAQARALVLADRPALGYDLLSLNTGSAPAPLATTDDAPPVIPVKPVSGLLAGLAEIERHWADSDRAARIALVGGGAGGVELALSLAHRWRDWRRPPRLSLHTAAREVPAGHPAAVQRRLARELCEHGITVYAGAAIERVEADGLRADDGCVHAADAVIQATGGAAPAWLADSGLGLDAHGFLAVDAMLRSRSHANVFAAGDIAALPEPRPKSGVFAVRAGSVLAANLARAARGRRLKRFRVQRRALALIGTGDARAVASYGRFAPAGRTLWHLKDRIDRRFMARYNDLPAMDDDQSGAGAAHDRAQPPAMRCGGCGAKVGQPVLDRVLARLAAEHGGAGGSPSIHDDAAVFTPPAAPFVQSLDYLRDFVGDAYLLGEIAAQHALNDLYASGATPHSALVLASVPYAAEAVIENTLHQLLAGATRALGDAQATLLGGHTSESTELGIGLTVNGVLEGPALDTAHIAPGMALVLTRALGTGVLFAADMRHAARAPWISNAIAGMRQSGAAAAACLRTHGVVACTDVTGFGLAGHLHNLLSPRGLGAALELDALPLLDGAAHLAAQGYLSSLQPQNVRARRLIDADDSTRAHPAWRLLFDPQTAGGLLGVVPADRAEACVAALRAQDYADAACIGAVTDAGKSPRIAVYTAPGERGCP